LRAIISANLVFNVMHLYCNGCLPRWDLEPIESFPVTGEGRTSAKDSSTPQTSRDGDVSRKNRLCRQVNVLFASASRYRSSEPKIQLIVVPHSRFTQNSIYFCASLILFDKTDSNNWFLGTRFLSYSLTYTPICYIRFLISRRFTDYPIIKMPSSPLPSIQIRTNIDEKTNWPLIISHIRPYGAKRRNGNRCRDATYVMGK